MDPFLGEIRVFGFGFAPKGWAFCNGQLLSIPQFTALFALLGIRYGGNGTTNFGLPNLQSCVAVDAGQGAGLSQYQLGQTGGAPAVTLQGNQMPSHTHNLMASNDQGSSLFAANMVLAVPIAGGRGEQGASCLMYSTSAPTSPMDTRSIAENGGGGPHNNLQPFLVLNYCIALQGIYPPRS